jgi:hypothetical protein
MSNKSPHAEAKEVGVEASEPADLKRELISPIGYILGFSYPLLALSTGARGLYRLFFKPGVTNHLGPALSVLAALVYLIAAVGFFRRTPRWWRIAVAALTFEALLVLVVGTLSIVVPDLTGSTALEYFGRDYGFFPLIQPFLGLIWLLWPPTREAYGIAPREA